MRRLIERLRPQATPEGSLVVLLGATAGRMLLSLALTMLLGRNLPVEAFGFFALVSTVFSLAHLFTDMGTGNVAVRDTVRSPQQEGRTLEGLLGLRLVLSVLAALACAGLALFQPSWEQRLILLAAAAILLLSYFSAFSTVFQLRHAQLAPALLNVLTQLGTLLGCAVMVGFKAAGAVFAVAILCRDLAGMVGTRLLAVRLLGYSPRPRLRGVALRPFFGKAGIVALTTLCYHTQFHGGMFFVQFLRPEAELGAFAAAFRPMTPFLFVPWVLMLPLVPLLSWLADGRRAEFRRQTQGALELCAGVGAIVAVAAVQLAPAALLFLYGAKFSEGPLAAVAVFRWLALPLGCSFVAAALATALLADNRERQLLRLSLASLVLYLAANFVLLPRFQFTGAAIATAAAAGLMTVGGVALLGRGREGFVPGARLLLFLLPAAALYFCLGFVAGPAVVQLAIGGLLSALAVLAVWNMPGVAAYREEQARLGALARPGSAAAGAAARGDG